MRQRAGALLIVIALLLFGSTYAYSHTANPAPVPSQPAESHVPVQLVIPKIAVASSSFERVDVGAGGELAAPTGWNDPGWFQQSAPPGDPGPSIIVGHLDSQTGPALFWRLHELKTGDEIDVTRADHKTAVFTVTKTEVAPQNSQFPTQEVYGPINYPGLRLITCSGQFVGGRYTDNDIVFATLVRLQ